MKIKEVFQVNEEVEVQLDPVEQLMDVEQVLLEMTMYEEIEMDRGEGL